MPDATEHQPATQARNAAGSDAEALAADAALKARHAAMWALGDYPAVARELIAECGLALVAASGVRAGDRVLDVAAGSGNVAIPAALTGADVVATDLTPELFDVGQQAGRRGGRELEWREADAEALPFADDSFDVVLSLRRRDVRPASPAGRRRAGQRVPGRRPDRPAQLDSARASSARCSRP